MGRGSRRVQAAAFAYLATVAIAADGQDCQVRGQVHNPPCPSVGLGLVPSQAPHAQLAHICEDKQKVLTCLQAKSLPITLRTTTLLETQHALTCIHRLNDLCDCLCKAGGAHACSLQRMQKARVSTQAYAIALLLDLDEQTD